MGYTLNSAGTPIIAPTPTQTVVDMQAIVTFAKKFANMRVGTSSQRTTLPAGEVWEGLVFYETDTDITWQASSSTAWRILSMPLTAWTPTVTGLTLGNGTQRAFYTQSDKVVEWFIEMESGSTTAATGTLTWTLPQPVADVGLHRHIGDGYMRYTGGTAGSWSIEPRLTGASTVTASFLDSSGGLVTPGGNVTNTFPTSGAWGATAGLRPSIYMHGTYRTD